MRVRMLVAMAGPAINWSRDQVVDVPDDEAKRLVAAGYAEEVTAERQRDAETRPGARRRGAEKAVNR